MIDRDEESLMTLPAAAGTLPGRTPGGTVGTTTIWRWATAGLMGVRLETVMIGMTLHTSRDALDRFFAAVRARRYGEDIAADPIPRSTTKRRRRAIEEEDRRARIEFGLPLS